MTGFTASAFDLFHSGHVLFLEECKNNCDRLIVGLHVNPAIQREGKNRPVQTVFERYIQLAGCWYVDEIIVYETEQDLLHILQTRSIDVRFLGSDYKDRTDITGLDLVPITYIDRKHNWSSTELRERIKNA